MAVAKPAPQDVRICWEVSLRQFEWSTKGDVPVRPAVPAHRDAFPKHPFGCDHPRSDFLGLLRRKATGMQNVSNPRLSA